MENKKEKEYIYLKESAIQSIIIDTYMFGLIFCGFFANAFFFYGKWYIYLFFMFLAISSTIAKQSKSIHTFTNKQELKDFVEKL